VPFSGAGGGDQDDDESGDDNGHHDPEQRQPGSPRSGRGLCLLDLPAFCACLLAALLARRVFLVLASLQCAHAWKLIGVAAGTGESGVGEVVIRSSYYGN
jgi:hypothetical protein